MKDEQFTTLVAAALQNWVWTPPDGTQVVTDEYRLTHHPTFSVVRLLRPVRPVHELVAEVTRLAQDAGGPVLRWWASDTDNPEVEAHLRAAGLPLAEAPGSSR